IGAGAVVVVAMVAVVVGAGSVAGARGGRNMVGTSKEASCVLGACDVDARKRPPARSTTAATGLVRRSVQRRFIGPSGPQTAATRSIVVDWFRLAASEPLRPGRTVCPGKPGLGVVVGDGRDGRARYRPEPGRQRLLRQP